MGLINKINNIVDYKNPYSIKKILFILEPEKNAAVGAKNTNYLKLIYNLCVELITNYKTNDSDLMPNVWIKRLKMFVENIKKELNI